MAKRSPSVEIDLTFSGAIRALGDAERGRLFTAILDYEETGQAPELGGNERVIFASVKARMDLARAQRERISRRNRQNGQYGGRPKNQNNPVKPKQTQTNPKNPLGFEKEKGSPASPPLSSPLSLPPDPYPLPPYNPPCNTPVPKEKDSCVPPFGRDACAEPEAGSTPPVVSLPLNDGSEFGVCRAQVLEWEALYPAVDVEQQLRAMRGWLLSNPAKRKTRRGVARFVNGWLAREQDRGGGRPIGQAASGNPFLDMLAEEVQKRGQT